MTASSRSPTRAPASASASKRKPPNPKPPPRMRWDVTGPPPRHERRGSTERSIRPNSRCSWNVNSIPARSSTRTRIFSTRWPRAKTRTRCCCRRPSCRRSTCRRWTRAVGQVPVQDVELFHFAAGVLGTAMADVSQLEPTRAPWHDPFEMDEFEGEGRVVCAELPNVFVVARTARTAARVWRGFARGQRSGIRGCRRTVVAASLRRG